MVVTTGPPSPVMKMTGIQHLACLWTLLVTQSGSVSSELQLLERHEGESVVLPCVFEQFRLQPAGVYLKRRWLQPGTVLFKYTNEPFAMDKNESKKRIKVSGDPSNYFLNVTISQLWVNDTGGYYCEFIVENSFTEDEHIPGRNDFFLLVTAGEQCVCSSYSTLLYALSSAVVVLFLLLGCVMIYQAKARRSVRSHPQAPIYEEMAGVKPLSRKLADRHPEEIDSSVYRNSPVKKSCPENHYESPRGTFSSQDESPK